MNTDTAATVTRTSAGHYTVTVEGQTLEFNRNKPYAFLVLGRHTISGETRWTLRACTNTPQSVEYHETIMRRNWPNGDTRVVIVPVPLA